MRPIRTVLAAGFIALAGLCTMNAFAFSEALLDLQRQGLIDLSLPHLPPVAQTPCPNPGPGRDECIMTTEDGRQVIITSPPLVDGCVEGLVKLRGVWVCRAFLTSSGTAALSSGTTSSGSSSSSSGSSIAGGSGSGSSVSGSGHEQGGYADENGVLHVNKDPNSQPCNCDKELGKTDAASNSATTTPDGDTTTTTTTTDATTTTTTSDTSTSTTTTTTDHDTNDTDHDHNT